MKRLAGQGLYAEQLEEIVGLCANLYRQDTPYRWFFLLVNRCLARLLDNHGPADADLVYALLAEMQHSFIKGIEGMEQERTDFVLEASNLFTEAYSRYSDLG